MIKIVFIFCLFTQYCFGQIIVLKDTLYIKKDTLITNLKFNLDNDLPTFSKDIKNIIRSSYPSLSYSKGYSNSYIVENDSLYLFNISVISKENIHDSLNFKYLKNDRLFLKNVSKDFKINQGNILRRWEDDVISFKHYKLNIVQGILKEYHLFDNYNANESLLDRSNLNEMARILENSLNSKITCKRHMRNIFKKTSSLNYLFININHKGVISEVKPFYNTKNISILIIETIKKTNPWGILTNGSNPIEEQLILEMSYGYPNKKFKCNIYSYGYTPSIP